MRKEKSHLWIHLLDFQLHRDASGLRSLSWQEVIWMNCVQRGQEVISLQRTNEGATCVDGVHNGECALLRYQAGQE